jgi:hypothetical protein
MVRKFFLLFLFSFFIFQISLAQTISVSSFNQTSSINITGIASTIDQATINSYLNTNGDNLTWDVLESEVPQREQKTVEYFIYQDMTQMPANTERSATFTIYIPEKNPVIKSAIIEIKNLVYNTQITAGGTVKIWNGTTNTTLLTTGAGPLATGENLFYYIYANATPALNYIRQNGTYTFTLYVRLNPIRQGENAKLILTYEYDSDSQRQIKTVRFFVGQRTTPLAVGSSTAFTIPPLNLPEGNVIVRDSFFETYIHLKPGGTVDEGISIDLDGANAISGTPIDNAGGTTIDYVFLYRNIFDTSTSHTFNFRPTAGYAIDTVGAELVLTYEYDANSPIQLKTVKYLIGQDTGLYTTAHTATFRRQITLPENNINIKSIYNRISFAIAYGAGAGATSYTTTIGVNSTIQGGSPATQVSYSLGLFDEQVSTSMILYNATNLYNLRNGDTVICSVFSSAATTSFYTGSKGCELIITYAFNSSSPQRIRTVDYFVGQNYNGSLVTSISFRFSFSIPESSYSLRDAYLTVYGFTGSATTGTNTLVSGIVVPGYVNQTCNFRNTGEARFDRCWDYVLDNVTSPGSYTAIFGSSVTRWFSSTITITYTYQVFYQLSVEHNATVSYNGTLRNISVLINFTSTNSKIFNMSIYDFANSNWIACQNISASPNVYYAIWCNISLPTYNPTNFISSDGKIRVRLNTTISNVSTTLKEEYVQFYLFYSVGYLEVKLISPDANTINYIIQNQTFWVNASVTCRNGDCGIVNGTVLYNLTSNYPDTPINTTYGDKSFFINETPASATKTCGVLLENQNCNLSWLVNATGDTSTYWKIGVVFNSNFSYINKNSTENATIYISSCSVDFSLSWNSIDFGILNPSTQGNPAPGNSNLQYNITVNPGSCNLDFYIKGDDLYNSQTNTYLKISNMTFSNTTNSYSSSYRLLNTYQLLFFNKGFGNYTTYYWIDIPPIYAGTYTSKIYILGVLSGTSP